MSHNDHTEDARTLADMLLSGFVRYDKKGLPHKVYLGENSPEELRARTAMANLLRNPRLLTVDLGAKLAALFDPEAGTYPGIERRIVIRHRSRGNRREHMRNTQIGKHVWDRVQSKWKVEAAVESAIDTYDLTREEIYRIWARYRPMFEAYDPSFDYYAPPDPKPRRRAGA
jgi:hypothetical protein